MSKAKCDQPVRLRVVLYAGSIRPNDFSHLGSKVPPGKVEYHGHALYEVCRVVVSADYAAQIGSFIGLPPIVKNLKPAAFTHDTQSWLRAKPFPAHQFAAKFINEYRRTVLLIIRSDFLKPSLKGCGWKLWNILKHLVLGGRAQPLSKLEIEEPFYVEVVE